MRNLKVSMFLLFSVAIFAELPSYSFDEGWNLIGGSDSPFSAAYIDTIEGIVPPVYRFDTETSGYVEVDSIFPLVGYWVLSSDSFTMGSEECGCPPTVTDIDSNVYPTILIGEQCWMLENLKVTHYTDGSEIPNVTDDSEWVHLSSGAYRAYGDDPTNIETYGLLYNWFAVDDERGLAPEGWHVATDEDWAELEVFLGIDTTEVYSMGSRGTDEGSKLAGNSTLWVPGELRSDPSFGESGFNLLPAGACYFTGEFIYLRSNAYYWTSTDSYGENALSRHLAFYETTVARCNYQKTNGFSVRCIKD